MSKYLDVVNWDESSLDDLPEQETDEYEYKSSKIANQDYEKYRDTLKLKIQKAASAFWNSGGGYFIVGYDEKTRNIDGGIPSKMGRENLSDWVDTVLHQTEPVGNYKIKLIKAESENSLIDEDKVILVIGFAESHNLPHMANDKMYYIRAGAHSKPARHFIVEALRNKRTSSKPMLYSKIQLSPVRSGIFELTIGALNQAPARDVKINIIGLPKVLVRTLGIHLPLTIPIINEKNPFRMEIASYLYLGSWENELKGKNWIIELNYYDLNQNQYSEKQTLSPLGSVGPLQFGETMEHTLKDIQEELERIRKAIEKKN